MEKICVKLSSETLNLDVCYDFVTDDSCGGIAVFIGTVRNDTKGKKVIKLEFSAYKPMAIKEMQKIAKQASRPQKQMLPKDESGRNLACYHCNCSVSSQANDKARYT